MANTLRVKTIEEFIFAKTNELAISNVLIYTDINSWASETNEKSCGPIHHLPIYTNTDSNVFFCDF